MKSPRKWLLWILLMLAISIPVSFQVQFYVSPTGDDTANGSASAPLRTISRAQQAVQSWLPGAPASENVTVNITPGDYRITSPLTFTSTDSGSTSRTVCDFF